MQAKAHAGNPAFGREAHGFQEDAVQVRGVHADPGVAHWMPSSPLTLKALMSMAESGGEYLAA